jgi:hypothetical protein
MRFPAQRPANVVLPRHYDSHLRSIFRKHARGLDLISPFRGAGLVSAKPPSIRGGPLTIWDRLLGSLSRAGLRMLVTVAYFLAGALEHRRYPMLLVDL